VQLAAYDPRVGDRDALCQLGADVNSSTGHRSSNTVSETRAEGSSGDTEERVAAQSAQQPQGSRVGR
jgi:hypothetical protein